MNDFINILVGHVTNSFVSTLMLGILTGWLIEWLFYNFIWKNSRTATKYEEECKEQKVEKEEELNQSDDFTKLVGIGPSMDKRLKDIGITSFLQLSEISVDTLMEQLTATSARVNNKTIMKSWAKQATLANLADFDALKIFQNTLKKG